MAQKLSRGIQKVAKQREQEDAQEFLTFLLDSAHQELLKLRAMYDTQGGERGAVLSEQYQLDALESLISLLDSALYSKVTLAHIAFFSEGVC